MSFSRFPAFILSLAVTTSAAFAADVWLLRGSVGPCEGLQYEADALLFNETLTPAVVRLVSLSDGPDGVTPRELEIPPRQVVSLRVRAGDWRPQADVPLWMLHLDVPPDVRIEGALNLGTGTGNCVLVPTPDRAALYGTTALPVFRALVPAGEEQIHLNTSLGAMRSRNNIGIYNAGPVAATARVEVRRDCDDALLASSVVSVAPNSILQVSLQPEPVDGCTAAHRDVQPWVESVRLTVDQPSVTWVSSIAAGQPSRVVMKVR